jgi:hypothetical protein
VRPDHAAVWENLHAQRVYVMTHVMELSRVDGSLFTAAEAEPVLDALHVAVSFALGRWVAPMLPVGKDASDNVVWERWQSLFCDPARRPSSGWWYDRDLGSLAALLDLVIEEFNVPDRRTALSMQIKYAITAIYDRGFMEQRVTIGAAGLEHLMWQTLVLTDRLTKPECKSTHAYKMLRTLLTEANIPTTIDADVLPAAAAFAAAAEHTQGHRLDGAEVVTQIRNRLVHPEGTQDAVYGTEGLVRDVWLLTRNYLALLILHSLGYVGAYRNLTRVTGHPEIGKVPWA